MTAPNNETVMATLEDALRLLATDAKEQIALFPSFVSVADEIALTVNDALVLLQDREIAPEWVLEAVRNIDAKLAELSTTPHDTFWTNDGVMSDTRWQHLRSASRSLLSALGAPRSRPSLDAVYLPEDED